MTQLPALHELKVLDLSRVLAGPLAAQILADLGADVVKIERPGKGDDTREWAPPFLPSNSNEPLENSAYFWACNRGKKSLTANISTKEGKQLVRSLAIQADVVIENYKVGTLARYGLDYDSLSESNPRLIYCSITGFGQTGPYSHKPGYDTIVQALGGLMSITGPALRDNRPAEPSKSGIAVADQLTALYSVVAILAAVQERRNSGLGRCSDGEIMLIVGNDEQFKRFCEAMGIGSLSIDPRFATNPQRLKNVQILDPLLREAFLRKSVTQCQQALDNVGVPAAPINNLESVFKDPQVVSRKMVRSNLRSDGSEVRMLANPIRMSRSPVLDDRAAPKLGEHSAESTNRWPI